MQQASDSELELMKVIWDNVGSALYAEITALLAEKGMIWTKNTIITLLSRLIDKGYLKTNKVGRRNRYLALIQEGEYQLTQTEHFVDKIYGGNVKGMVLALLQTEMLSAEDYEILKEYWEKAGEQDV